nr:zinc finger, RING/FYVE/PHD-type [Tanacetum cinerariifolium]
IVENLGGDMANTTNINHMSIVITYGSDNRSFSILHKSYEDSDDEDDDYIIEDEDEQIKEEMTPPKVVTCEETGLKGVVVVFKHDWSTLGLWKTPPSAFDHPCTICAQPFSTGGKHRVWEWYQLSYSPVDLLCTRLCSFSEVYLAVTVTKKMGVEGSQDSR